MEKITIKKILQEMKDTVEQGQIQSPNWWIDRAIRLNVLWQDLKDVMTAKEMEYKGEIVALIETGSKISQATLIVESKSTAYKDFMYCKGRDKVIEEFIKLAKKRASVESYQE